MSRQGDGSHVGETTVVDPFVAPGWSNQGVFGESDHGGVMRHCLCLASLSQ